MPIYILYLLKFYIFFSIVLSIVEPSHRVPQAQECIGWDDSDDSDCETVDYENDPQTTKTVKPTVRRLHREIAYNVDFCEGEENIADNMKRTLPSLLSNRS